MAQDKIRLLAVDLDDSLLGSDLGVSPRNREALAVCKRAGVRVVLATGRMYRSAERIALELGLDDPVIAYQGALVKWPGGPSGPPGGGPRVIQHLPLPLDLAREVIGRVAPYGYHINVYLDDTLHVAAPTEEVRRYAALSGVGVRVVGDLLSFLSEDPTKVLVIAAEEKLDALAFDLTPLVGGKLNITKSKPHFLEFSHREASKGQALAKLAGLFGVRREEVMAVGDSYNDLDMVEYAGIGVVMGNARPEIKSRADFITTANDCDGVALAVERFVLGSGV
ncbi:MAG: Cof-type HAD-IIB family hydrolase [Peptococcaceae bacterium]|nr:Cof-type HAD-IIB family hydrolase [Peptococcaceae bacterium]